MEQKILGNQLGKSLELSVGGTFNGCFGDSAIVHNTKHGIGCNST